MSYNLPGDCKMIRDDNKPGQLPSQHDQSHKNPPIRVATIILALLTAVAGILVWRLYPSLPDPMILEKDKATIPLMVVVGLIFFVQVNVVLVHHLIRKKGKFPPLIKQHLIYIDIFFVLFSFFWLGLSLRFLLESIGYYFRLIYFGAGTVALFSGYFSYLGSRPWVTEALLRSDMAPKTQARWIKAYRFSSKVLGILAGFACLGFIFPDWPAAVYFIGGSVLVLVALVPLQSIYK